MMPYSATMQNIDMVVDVTSVDNPRE